MCSSQLTTRTKLTLPLLFNMRSSANKRSKPLYPAGLLQRILITIPPAPPPRTTPTPPPAEPAISAPGEEDPVDYGGYISSEDEVFRSYAQVHGAVLKAGMAGRADVSKSHYLSISPCCDSDLKPLKGRM